MHGRGEHLAEIPALIRRLGAAAAGIEVLLCPPAPYIEAAAKVAAGTAVMIGGQDCSAVQADSARTGEISAAMLADSGARYVILGHSERRAQYGESDALVRLKAEAALQAGLIPIICVGETKAERAAGKALDVVGAQVRESSPETAENLVIAYEPLWCVGADRTPTANEIAAMHALIRTVLAHRFGPEAEAMRVIYGGAVNAQNAPEVFSCPGVDGALVGRASLKAADFAAIILAHPAAA